MSRCHAIPMLWQVKETIAHKKTVRFPSLFRQKQIGDSFWLVPKKCRPSLLNFSSFSLNLSSTSLPSAACSSANE